MIEYELQQLLVKDIDFIQKQKSNVMDREAKNALFEVERQKIKEQRDKMNAERRKRDEEYKAR